MKMLNFSLALKPLRTPITAQMNWIFYGFKWIKTYLKKTLEEMQLSH